MIYHEVYHEEGPGSKPTTPTTQHAGRSPDGPPNTQYTTRGSPDGPPNTQYTTPGGAPMAPNTRYIIPERALMVSPNTQHTIPGGTLTPPPTPDTLSWKEP